MIPPTSPRLLRVFSRYCRWYLRRNFDAIRLSRAGTAPLIADDQPLIIVMNHASWWDPLIGLLLADRIWPHRRHFAPIDAAALLQYPMLKRLGLFGIEKDSMRGGAAFLRTTMAILNEPGNAVWITAEGHFADPRDRSSAIKAGVARLAARVPAAAIVPLAIEYPFWQQRHPEALCRFGPIVQPPQAPNDALRQTQDALAAEAIRQDAALFQTLLDGNAGINIVYDAWRGAAALLRGQRFSARHGERGS